MAQSLPSPDTVGSSFIQKYYSMWLTTPEELHRFYQSSSLLSRPGPDGSVRRVTTIKDINELLSLHGICHVRILSSESQYTHNGVMVSVTGLMTGEDAIERMFTQAFLLGYQGAVYYVLNDIFSFVDNDHVPQPQTVSEPQTVLEPVADDSTNEVVHAAETTQVVDRSVDNLASPPEENVNDNDETNHQLENGEKLIAEKVVEIAVPESKSTTKDVAQVAEKAPVVKDDAPKMSYASLVNALKENPIPFKEKPQAPKPLPPVPTPEAPAAANAPVPTPTAPVAATHKAPAPSSQKPSKIDYRTAKGYPVFVRNLPGGIAREDVERIFKRFGNIKSRGVTVRGFKDAESCFGFVDFVSKSSMEGAIKASPICIDGFEVYIEMKRQDANNGRSRAGFQNGNVQQGRGYESETSQDRGNTGGNGNGNGNYNARSSNNGSGNGNGNYNARSSSNGYGNGNAYSRNQGVYQNGGSAPQTAKAQRN